MLLNKPPLVFVLKILLTFVIPYTILESLSIWSMGQMLHSCLVITSQLQIPLSFLTENFNAILTLLITIALGNPRPRALSKFVHRNGNDNPDDIVTNSCASNTWSLLTKPLIFCHDMEFLKAEVVDEGSENRSSTPPLSQSKGTPHQSFKLYLRHNLGD